MARDLGQVEGGAERMSKGDIPKEEKALQKKLITVIIAGIMFLIGWVAKQLILP